MIIGITGFNASGKDTFANYLVKRGYKHYSLSEVIKEEAAKKKLEPSRDNLISLGNELRSKFGANILAERILLKLKEDEDYVITSIRNPAEVEALKERDNFVFIAVEAEAKKRYELMKQRRESKDNIQTYEEFIEKEKIEQSSEAHKQQLDRCLKMAKIKITNSGTVEELHTKIDKLLLDLNKKYRKRPSWDEYFLRISREVAKRATCDRGKAGCVIVRDKRMLCTGYVGSPASMPHCDEVGHQFKTMIHEDGSNSKHCMRTIHAEQNAICQAAREGLSLKGATLYCKMEPCSVCARMIANCGITRVVCEYRYQKAQETRELFKMAKIKLEVLNNDTQGYAK
ncbi:AAA family ATPase [Candidatus Woesearchaeota archaeon]|nr:AAA family ATPase [Candidatus Woesearchaeota archaeon]